MERNNQMPIDIAAVGYNKEYETLQVKFKNGVVYEYYDFPQEVLDQFIESEAPTEFYIKVIRDIYPFSRSV